MKVLAFNGSARKDWNTAALLKSALEGAAACGAEVEIVHLYDLVYKGCTSCFSCKLKGGKSYGRCAMRDDLTPFLRKIETADGILLGSPVYLGAASGMMRSLLERLVFPFYTYTDPPTSLYPGKTRLGIFYTFGATEAMAVERGWPRSLSEAGAFMERVFGPDETLWVYDTLQFKDYSRYVATRFDPEAKLKRRKEVFPQDCRKAFELGGRLVSHSKKTEVIMTTKKKVLKKRVRSSKKEMPLSGKRHTAAWKKEEQRRKQGKNNPMYGKKHRRSTIQKIRHAALRRFAK